jgi:hypothetical protein
MEMEINIWIVLLATLVPLAVGMIWYSPKIGFGKAWMTVTGMTEEKAKESNMALVFGLTTLFSFFVAFAMQSIVIHQFHVAGLMMTQPDFAEAGSRSSEMMKMFMSEYGESYRTFKHGAFHGTLAGIMIALPVLGVNALFEGKRFRYIAINAGYWIISMALMGGVICAFT